MNNKAMFFLLVMFLIFSFLVTSCDLLLGEQDAENVAQTYVAQTEAAERLVQNSVAQTQLAQADDGTAPATEEAPTPSPQFSPTSTQTPTETQTPMPQAPSVHVEVDTNCRSGPGSVYAREGGLLTGEKAEVVGRYDQADYWIIENPERTGECWLWGKYATLEGPTDDLPAYTQPPTPTPTFTPAPEVDWSGTWETTQIGGAAIVHIVTVAQSGNTATGSYPGAGGGTVSMSGSLSADYQTWSGSYTLPGGGTGTFVWVMVGTNQFRGSADGSIAWCGFSQGSGAGNPSPCMGP